MELKEKAQKYFDEEKYAEKVKLYQSYIDNLNSGLAKELLNDKIVLDKKLFDAIHRGGTDTVINAIRLSHENEISKIPDAVKESLPAFNQAKFYQKYQNIVSTNNWLKSQYGIDYHLIDCKNGECYLPKESMDKIREIYSVTIDTENKKKMIELMESMKDSASQLGLLIKSLGYNPGNCIWDDNYGLFSINYDTGELNINWLFLKDY